MNYKIGDHVVCEKSNVPSFNYKGKTGVINRIDMSYEYPYRCTMDDGSDVSWCTVSGLAEEKKMFTKKDLKNGDVIVRRNGWVEIALVDLDMFITPTGWNSLSEVEDDLTDHDDAFGADNQYDIMKVYRPNEMWKCQFSKSAYESGELVYDRERDTKKPRYNGKVVCITKGYNGSSPVSEFTVGKIYEIKDGVIISNFGYKSNEYRTLNDLCGGMGWTFIPLVE